VKLYAVDVDDTLDVSGGPVPFESVIALRNQGHITGLCGNWAVVTGQVPFWWLAFSFLGPLSMTKPEFLKHIAMYVRADDYVMVGNDPANVPSNRVAVSNDSGAASEAGWRFIKESDFAAGQR
jgi:hypothetical protein